MVDGMLQGLVSSGFVLVKSPGVIVGPIAKVLGIIYNIFFNFIYGISEHSSLAIAIVLFTLFIKVVLSPLTYNQMKSTYKMQKIQPEINKIKAKYEGKKDRESQQRMAFEMQEVQKKNGISMLGGCLPMIIQLPILYALFYIFQQAYMYIDVIGANYTSIADIILTIPVDLRMQVFTPFAEAVAKTTKTAVDLGVQSNVVSIISQISLSDWSGILASLGDYASKLSPLLEHKHAIEYIFGISVITKPGLSFPGILIPILAAFTTWLSSKSIQPKSADKNDPNYMMTQTMTWMMPAMMGFFSITLPSGLGIYWSVSNLFQIANQKIMEKYFKVKEEKKNEGAGSNG
ncbi:MAG: YidC/Oxa1 family membrane protein insertase [Lachnospiraceae bacterium]|nr:YidC/Oxa1 family membrane protein insertase [Lachnospiraceae bacterium]